MSPDSVLLSSCYQWLYHGQHFSWELSATLYLIFWKVKVQNTEDFWPISGIHCTFRIVWSIIHLANCTTFPGMRIINSIYTSIENNNFKLFIQQKQPTYIRRMCVNKFPPDKFKIFRYIKQNYALLWFKFMVNFSIYSQY